jgi:hypothetical protein
MSEGGNCVCLLSIHLVCRVVYGFICANRDCLSLLKVEVIQDGVLFQSIVRLASKG